MKKALALAILCAALSGAARAELDVVSTEHRAASYFKRLSEYFTGKENPGRHAIFRTDASQRDGFYISLRATDEDILPRIASVRLQFVRPGTQEIETIDLPAESVRKPRILVGMTSSEWSGPTARPVAWSVELIDASGQTLESAQSFLWATP